MNLWERFARKKVRCSDEKEGLCFHFAPGIEPDFRRLCMQVGRWLRKSYRFPVPIHVHFLNQEKVRLLSGAMAYGSFRWFPKRPPYIRIPCKVEAELREQYTKEELYDQMLSSLLHELTHYYQWVLDLEQSAATSERQANYYRYRILDRYYDAVSDKKGKQ